MRGGAREVACARSGGDETNGRASRASSAAAHLSLRGCAGRTWGTASMRDASPPSLLSVALVCICRFGLVTSVAWRAWRSSSAKAEGWEWSVRPCGSSKVFILDSAVLQ